MRKMKIKVGKTEVEAVLTNKNPETADAIWRALPLRGKTNRWGDEIYFEIPVRTEKENSQEVVEMGDMGFWPPGHALCIFFGPTPVSKKGEIRAYSAVNVFARVVGDTKVFKEVGDGEEMTVSRI